MNKEFEPPIKEIIVFQPEDFPLHRWDNSSSCSARRPVKVKDADFLPRLPFRRSRNSQRNVDASATTVLTSSTTSDDKPPRCPDRRLSLELPGRDPLFLASQPVGPCRRPPSRSKGYNHNLDLHQIPLKPIKFDGKKVKEGIAQVLQGVVMEGCPSGSACADRKDSVSVVFAIRRPGCGQCREHGMQLAEIAETKPNIHLTGALKQTTGINLKGALHSFYTDYFPFPLYMDAGWDLHQTIGNKKLSVFKMCARAPGLESHYKKRGIRNMPLGGDLFAQGGVLIFDKDGKLRFVYYETYGKPLDMEAINWAIEEANKPVDQ